MSVGVRCHTHRRGRAALPARAVIEHVSELLLWRRPVCACHEAYRSQFQVLQVPS